ncbi:MAG: ABC transporter ATP-binding protein [Ruminococcaceae bacterium]|nr:ABC transporter ATP-binding protein [Oscillospiraceae bacterium]
MKKKTFRRILSLTKPYGGLVLCNLLCAAITVAAGLLIPIFCGNAIDAMIGAGRVELPTVLRAITWIAFVTLISAVAQKLMALSGNRITYSVCRNLRDRISEKMHKLPVAYSDTHSVGDTVSRTVSDVDTFADGLLMGFTQLFSACLTIGAVLGVMLYLNPVIALVVIVLTPMSILVARFIATRTHRHFVAQAKVRGEETGLVSEMIEGARVIKAFGHEEESLAAFDEVNGRLADASMKATFFSSLVNPSTRVVNNLVYAAVALICALYAGNGGISIGELSVFLSYASQYAKPFNEISSVITELQNAFACASRAFEFLDAEEEVADPENASAPEKRGEVVLKNVSFRYTPERPLIEDLSLTVSPGQRIAIVGPTGCGKTTLINLLMRFYDVTGGSISVDGVDIRDMNRHELRSRYGMVLQDTWLKEGTVRDNIAYGKPDATEEEIIAAAKRAHAHSFIRRLPKGYDTKVVENGSNFSAGQRQLLCIARAMLALAPMLILDEATSSIDTRTELKIQDAFNTMMQGRTSFIVAHRLSTVKEADLILVMKDGHVIEKGNHEELLKENGFYAMLYNSQFSAV